MISKQDAMAAITLLVKAGYVSASEAQAEVWAALINEGAPNATPADLAQSVRTIATSVRTWVTTGDVIAELKRAREAEYHEQRRQRQLERRPGDGHHCTRDEIAEIFARHGQTITFRERTA